MIALLVAALLLGPVQSASTRPSSPSDDTVAKTGSRVAKPAKHGSNDQRGDREESARILQSFAGCMIGRKPAQLAAIVDPPYGTPDAERLRRIKAMESTMSLCLGDAGGGWMGSPYYLMVGAFAEQLYRRYFVRLPALGEVEVPPAVHPDQVPILETLRFANCLIDHDPNSVDVLVRSNAGSSVEAAKFDSLAPHYGVCLDAGSKLALNRQSLRAALAEHLYRRALAGRNGSAAASAIRADRK